MVGFGGAVGQRVWGRGLGERAPGEGRFTVQWFLGGGRGSVRVVVGTWWVWLVALASLPGPRLSLARMGKADVKVLSGFSCFRSSASILPAMCDHGKAREVTDKV